MYEPTIKSEISSIFHCNGDVWFVMDRHFNLLRNNKIFSTNNDFGHNIKDVKKDDTGIFILSYNKLWVWDEENKTVHLAEKFNAEAIEPLHTIVIDSKNSIYFKRDAFNRERFNSIAMYHNDSIFELPETEPVLDMYEIHLPFKTIDDKIYFVGGMYFYYYSNNKWHRKKHGIRNYITCAAFDLKGSYWFGTDHGLYQYKDSVINFYDRRNSSIPFEDIQSIAVDSRNTVWFTSENSDISSFDGQYWKSYNKNNSGFIENKITDFVIDSLDNIWIVTETSGLYIYDGEEFQKYNLRGHGVIGNNINNIEIDQNGNIWVSTEIIIAQKLLHNWKIYHKDNSATTGSADNNIINNQLIVGYGWHRYILNKEGKCLKNNALEHDEDIMNYTSEYIWATGRYSHDYIKLYNKHRFMEQNKPLQYYTGKVFLDSNSNGLFDKDESGVSGQKIQIGEQSRFVCISSGLNGDYFSLYEYQDTVIIKLFQKDRFENTTPNTFVLEPGKFAYTDLNFGVKEIIDTVPTDDKKTLRFQQELNGKIRNIYKTEHCNVHERKDEKNRYSYCKSGYFIEEEYEYFPNNKFSIIKQHSSGNIIAVNKESISVFNGKEWRNIYDVNINNTSLNISAISITCLAIDNNGCYWIGTERHGLFFYDGKIWKQYNNENSDIPRNYIQKIFIDSQNNIWLGNKNELVYYDHKNWITFNTDNTIYSFDCTFLKDSDIWIMEKKNDDIRFSKINFSNNTLNTDSTFSIPNKFLNSSVNINSFKYRDNKLYFTSNGWLNNRYGYIKYLLNYNFKTSLIKDIEIPLNPNDIKEYEILNDTLWVVSGSYGLYKCYNDTLVRFHQHNSNIPSDMINTLFIDDENKLWITTENGIAFYHRGKITAFQNNLGLSVVRNINSSVYSKNYQYMNTWNGELYYRKTDDNKWTVYPNYKDYVPNGLTINGIHADSKGDLYFLINGYGIVLCGNTEPQLLLKKNVVNTYNHKYVFFDSKDNIWVDYGCSIILYYDGKKWETFNDSQYGVSTDIFFACDKNGTAWHISSRTFGRFNGKKWKYLNREQIKTKYPNGLQIDSKNNFWIKSKSQIECFDGQNSKIYALNEFDSNKYGSIDKMILDHDDTLWILTSWGKIYKCKDGKITTLDTEIFTQGYNIDIKDLVLNKKGQVELIAEKSIIRVFCD